MNQKLLGYQSPFLNLSQRSHNENLYNAGHGFYTEECAKRLHRLYLKDEFARNEQGRLYRLNAVKDHSQEMALAYEFIREFVEKVYIYHPEKINGQKTQRVRIVWNCIGEIPTQLENKTA